MMNDLQNALYNQMMINIKIYHSQHFETHLCENFLIPFMESTCRNKLDWMIREMTKVKVCYQLHIKEQKVR